MANDPFNSEENKRKLARNADGSLADVSPTPLGERAAPPRQPGRLARAATAALDYGTQAAKALIGPSRAAREQSVRDAEVSTTTAPAVTMDSRADLDGAGLTRIYKTKGANGENVYTDQAFLDAQRGYGAGPTDMRGAEVRHYGQMGVQLDSGLNPTQMAQAGEAQRRVLGRTLVDAEKRAQEAAAAAQGPLSNSDRIAMARLGLDQQKFAADQQRNIATDARQDSAEQRQQEDQMRKSFRDNPQLFLREELGKIRGDEQAQQAYFKSPRGRFLRSLVDDAAQEKYDENARGLSSFTAQVPRTVGQLRKPTGTEMAGRAYAAFQPWNFLAGGVRPTEIGNYITPSDPFQGGVDLGDVGLNRNDTWMLDLLADMEANKGS